MSMSDDLREQLARQVPEMQFIAVLFALLPVFQPFFFPSPLPAATDQACGMALAMVAARLIVPPLVVRSQCRQIARGAWSPDWAFNGHVSPTSEAGKLTAVYGTRLFIAVALLECAASSLAGAYQIELEPLALGAAALLILLIAAHFPTHARVGEWVEWQLQQLNDDRQLEQFRQ